jgi:hypothetical protein
LILKVIIAFFFEFLIITGGRYGETFEEGLEKLDFFWFLLSFMGFLAFFVIFLEIFCEGFKMFN